MCGGPLRFPFVDAISDLWRPSACQGIRVRPSFEQHSEQWNMSVEISRVESHPPIVPLRIRISPRCTQHAAGLDPSTPGSHEQRSLLIFLAPSVHVGAFCDQMPQGIQSRFAFPAFKQPNDRWRPQVVPPSPDLAHNPISRKPDRGR
ncbi:hypothetical protein G6F65_021596 [Rhizopus arrhizus]|nr:hypothetical protein G6F65_021596 [Rhizopus arrhizus]